MTGNIIVSTCCLGDMAVNAPRPGGGGAFTAISPLYHPCKHVLTITNELGMVHIAFTAKLPGTVCSVSLVSLTARFGLQM